MLVIRLTRIGKKNQPSYRVVLADKKRAVKGKFIEILGSYNPRLKTKALKGERITYWLSKGAQASPTVHNMLVSEKIISGPKVKAWRPKKKEQATKSAGEQPKEVKSEAPAEAAAEAVADAKIAEAAAPAEEIKVDDVKAEAPTEEVKTEA